MFRGIAVLLVLAHHIVLMEKKWGAGDKILDDIWAWGQSGVDLFFIISGFVMVSITRNKFQNICAARRYIYNRLSRIYPLYWFYSLILLGVYLLWPSLINPSLGGKINFFESFFLLPQNTMPLLIVAWTLIYEMFFYMVFALLFLAPEKYLSKILITWGVCILILNVAWLQPEVSNVISGFTILSSPLCLEFIGGCLIARLIFNGFYEWSKVCLALGIMGLLLSVVYFNITLLNHLHRFYFCGLPYLAVIYGVIALEVSGSKRYLFFMQKIGDLSYSVYLSHSIVINAIGWLWASLFPSSHSIIWISLMVFGSLTAGFVSYRCIELPVTSYLKRVSPY